MLLHEFGPENGEAVVMLHGLAMSWDMLEPAAKLLAQTHRVIAVAVPGMDMEDSSEFTSVEEIAGQIEAGLLEKGISQAACLYGLSMGGGIALRMLAVGRISFRLAVIDAGITPYELPRPVTRLILAGDVASTLLARAWPGLLALAFPPEAYSGQAVERMQQVLKHMTPRSIRRAYDSTDNYTMPPAFPALPTRLEYWYGSRERKARRLDIQYVTRHVPGITLREIPDMEHGQYVITQPEAFAEDIRSRFV